MRCGHSAKTWSASTARCTGRQSQQRQQRRGTEKPKQTASSCSSSSSCWIEREKRKGRREGWFTSFPFFPSFFLSFFDLLKRKYFKGKETNRTRRRGNIKIERKRRREKASSLDFERSGACGYWLLSFPSAS